MLIARLSILVLVLGHVNIYSVDALLKDHPFSPLHLSNKLTNASSGFDFNAAWEPGPVIPASDELWCKSVSKGSTLLEAMAKNDEDAGRTFNPPRAHAKSDWDMSTRTDSNSFYRVANIDR